MKREFRGPTEQEQGILTALAAIILGTWARLIVPAMAGFPVNDGGLFYLMIKVLQGNGYRLPQIVQYNGLDIPFVYPPFGLYFGALTSGLLRVDPIFVVQWLPAIVSIPCIFLFYSLAKAIRADPLFAGVATLIFSLTPRVITWQVMGGGITRSFGLLFLLGTLYSLILLFKEGRRIHLVVATVFSALVVLSHPEATVHAIAFGLVVWLFMARNRRGALNAGLVATGTVLLTAPWWTVVLARFGVQPLLSAAQTGLQDPLALALAPLMRFTEEPTLAPIALLAIIGTIASITRRDLLLPTLLFVPFVIEPRFAPTPAMIPLALLAAIGLIDIILPSLGRIGQHFKSSEPRGLLESTASKVLFFYLALYFVINMFIADLRLWPVTVSPADKAAFAWIRNNVPAQRRFLVLTGGKEIFADPIQEWFPVLTNQVSQTTIQGREWIIGREFAQTAGNLQILQGCLSSEAPDQCVTGTSTAAGISYEYVLIARHVGIIQSGHLIAPASEGDTLITALQHDTHFQLVYQTSDFSIFSHTSR